MPTGPTGREYVPECNCTSCTNAREGIDPEVYGQAEPPPTIDFTDAVMSAPRFDDAFIETVMRFQEEQAARIEFAMPESVDPGPLAGGPYGSPDTMSEDAPQTHLEGIRVRLQEFLQGDRETGRWGVSYYPRGGFQAERILLNPPFEYDGADEGEANERYTNDVLELWRIVCELWPQESDRLMLLQEAALPEGGTYSEASLMLTRSGMAGWVAVTNTQVEVQQSAWRLEVIPCRACDTVRPYSGWSAICAACYERCQECGTVDHPDEFDGDGLCYSCRIYGYCERCDSTLHHEDDAWFDMDDNGPYCESCYGRSSGSAYGPESREQPAEDGDFEGVSLYMSDMDGARTIRNVGLEIEGGGSGGGLASFLNNATVSPYSRPQGYHHQTRIITGEREPSVSDRGWSVESDATVDWECVSPILNLGDEEDASLATAGVRAIADYVATGQGWHDYRAGLHIHVGAEKIPVEVSYRLGRIWMYLEDTLFRLSAAKWGVHRTIEQGQGYCEPIVKWKTKQSFQLQVRSVGRYNALSFQNYLEAHLRSCQCGNCTFGSWDTCTCESLGKCTFEFRVFNATSNIVKVKAYTALCIALVSYAERMDNLTDEEFDERFPDLEFTSGRRPADELTIERLNFILNELPLTEDERRALLYCIRHSDLDDLESQLNIETQLVLEEEVVA